jgi:peptidoglycan/xylan/chitin deacetylase (PgdA/CDA1 family)
MRSKSMLLLAILALAGAVPTRASAQSTCADPSKSLGVSRVVEIDTSGGPIFGNITRQESEKTFLGPKEVVLTFDDGPMRRVTPQILDTLDAFCTKATFFVVGQMALSYPQGLRDTLARGHTVGTHTWSHPLSITRLSLDRAKAQIEQGFAAATLAAGTPLAPFFRFPGLSDSRELLAYMQERGIGSFTVDVVSNDSYIPDPNRLARLTLDRLRAAGHGIILFHDIKPATARALPGILATLKAEGYKVVHLRTKHTYAVPEAYATAMRDYVAKRDSRAGGHPSVLAAAAPFGSTPTLTDSGPAPVPVTALAPPARSRLPVTTARSTISAHEIVSPDDLKSPERRRTADRLVKRHIAAPTKAGPTTAGWSAQTRRSRTEPEPSSSSGLFWPW